MTPPILLDEVGSTNAWALAHGGRLADGQWVRARVQTAGRGRHGRAWAFHPGNLAASCVLRPRPGEGPPEQAGFVVALALFETCARRVPPARLMLKWPNDLMLDGGKLAGILLEREGEVVVAGVGVNLAVAPAVEGRKTAALGNAMEGPPPSPDAFLEDLAAAVERWRMRRIARGFAAVRQAWLERAHAAGTRLETRVGAQQVAGRFEDLGEDGALLLLVDTGERLVVHAGEVHLGPPPPAG